MNLQSSWPVLAGLALGLSTTRADSVVVFNEIMYHPPTNEAAFEWVELHNQMAVDVDLSGWSIAGGIDYTFPEGTVIAGGGYRVVALAPPALAATTGLTDVLGPFQGRLSNAGDTLRLLNNNQRLLDQVSYGVAGDWPVAPDGSGVSLAKQDEDAASARAESWTVSPLVGGTPGRRNFAKTPFEVTNATPVRIDSSWKYDASGVDPGADWKRVAFNDDAWPAGQGLFQAGAVAPPVGEPEPIATVFSTGIGTDGAVLAPGTPDPHYRLTQSAQSTPPPPPIPATVIENHPAWLANDAGSRWLGPVNPGTSSVADGSYHYQTTFTLEGFDPASAVVRMRFGADNRLNEVRLNGVARGIGYVGFDTWSGEFTVAQGFRAGTNTLDFLTANDGPGANPAGFRAQLLGTARRQFTSHTPLPTHPTTYYFRTAFAFDGRPQLAALLLNAVVADGAVFYLNGAEVLRLNLPPGPIGAATVAETNVPNPAYLGPFPLSTASLATGTNVLAVEVHQSAGGPRDLLFGAALSLTVTNVLIPPPITLAFNEAPAFTDANAWVEFLNHGATRLDLEGCVLARQGNGADREYVFPPQTLAPGEFAVRDRATLGFDIDPGDRLFLYSPGRVSVLDAVVAARAAQARWPDGIGRWLHPAALTPGWSNSVVLRGDVVINEILYRAPLPAGTGTNPLVGATDAWVELFNRGTQSTDLTGWRLGGDIGFAFAPATTIPPGGYLVIATDVGFMATNYPGVTVVGPFTNRLPRSCGSLVLMDETGNPADAVDYFDRRPWPEYADGGGSSLELRDPWADNAKPEAWAASPEASRAGWSNYTYRAVASNPLGPTQWNEFVMGLLGAGECLIDDLSVVENPSGAAVQMLQNGSFEAGLTAWRSLGTHSRSRVEVDPDNPANHVLHLIATGGTYHLHDHLETTYVNGRTVTNGREYQVSFRAKWLAGNNHLNTRLYFNRVARTSDLPMPSRHGTPGARNATFVPNRGPTFAALSHSPVMPSPTEPIALRVAAGDPQGVVAVSVRWSVNGGTWNTTPMAPASAGTEPGYSNYVAILPAQAAGARVQFFVQATDGLGALAAYPAAGADSRALFQVADGKPLMPQLHRLRLLMTSVDVARLHAPTNVMTDDRLGLTVVYDEREVFYDAGIHLQSSERGRNDPSRVGFNVRLNADHPFRGVQDQFTIDRSGGYSGRGGRHDEILLWHAVNHAGGLLGIPCDLVQVFAPRSQEDSTGLLRMSAFDGDYFDSQFAQGSDGPLYRLELIYYPTTTATGDPQAPKLPQPDDVLNVEIQDRGDNKESYRWIFLQENHADADNYGPVIALNKAFSLTGSALERQTEQLMDVDQWMRTLAFKAFTGDVDTFTYGLNHNWKVYFRPEDGRALGLLWDMDFSFVQAVNYAAPGNGSANMYKIATLPNNYRRFYNHLLDLLTTTVNAHYLGPWASHYAGLLGQDWSGLVSYLQQRADYLRGTMPLNTPFAISSNGGKDFSTLNDHATLVGTAPLTVKEIAVNGARYPLTWTSLTAWKLSVPLPGYTNRLALEGLDNYGNRLVNATDSITVTNLGAPALQPIVINEWMADNAGPGGFPDPSDGRYGDWFELHNPNPVPVNLSGFSLTDTTTQPAKWRIPTNTFLAAHGFLLVWADGQTNLNGLSPYGDLHASFQLGKSGDTIALFALDGAPQHTVVFGPQSQNISEGLFPDGDTKAVHAMPNWSPRTANQLGAPPAPQLGAVSFAPDQTLSFAVAVLAGRTYRVESADDVSASFWAPLGGSRQASSAELIVTDAMSGRSQRFYRVVLLP